MKISKLKQPNKFQKCKYQKNIKKMFINYYKWDIKMYK